MPAYGMTREQLREYLDEQWMNGAVMQERPSHPAYKANIREMHEAVRQSSAPGNWKILYRCRIYFERFMDNRLTYGR